MGSQKEWALKQEIFDNTNQLRTDHAEGASFYSIPAAFSVVRDQFISTVCSGCLKTKHPHNNIPLQYCSKCKFLKYCSRDCQARDWKKCHKYECGILIVVCEACPEQDTILARLFVRFRLYANSEIPAIGLPPMSFLVPEYYSEGRAEHWLTMFHQPQNCRRLFTTWKPILEVLDRHLNTNVRQLGCFMHSMAELISTCLPMFEGNDRFSQDPIAYSMFEMLHRLTTPFSKPNAVFVVMADPVHGSMLQMKAVRPLTAGDQVVFAEASNLLVSPINLRSQGAYIFEQNFREITEQMYIVEKAEILCAKCGDELKVNRLKEGSFGAMESIPFLDLCCDRCGFMFRSHGICDLLIDKVTKLTARSTNYTEQSENQLVIKVDELNDLINSLRPMVAGTSFALGILYRELADVFDKLGRIDKCIEAYKLLIPIVEKHIHKYDQNIFDGLSRVIVYHLERQEMAESLPYIEMAWDRLQHIPGKDSFDFHVVDKLRKAVQNRANFSFSDFCSVEPS